MSTFVGLDGRQYRVVWELDGGLRHFDQMFDWRREYNYETPTIQVSVTYLGPEPRVQRLNEIGAWEDV